VKGTDKTSHPKLPGRKRHKQYPDEQTKESEQGGLKCKHKVEIQK